MHGWLNPCVPRSRYFPYELKYAFPDGVPFKVTDKRTVNYSGGDAVKSGACQLADSGA